MPNDNDTNGFGTNPLQDIMKARDNEAHTVELRTRTECLSFLQNNYGNRFDILSEQAILKGGFLGIGQKEYYKIRYVVRPQEASLKQTFEESRRQILADKGADSRTYKRTVIIDEKLEDMRRSFEEKLANLQLASSGENKHPSIVKIENILTQNEFSLSFVNSITSRLRAELTIEKLDDFDYVQQTVFDWIGESIYIKSETPIKPPRVVILVGPTGVGKTTTIAKLAGQLVLQAKKKNLPKPNIRMITTDNTRVGAEEQLKKLADVIKVPLDNAKSAADVKKIFDENKRDMDVLFIDTPGYSPNDFESIGKMRQILSISGMNKDVYLAITASVKASDLLSISKVYEQFEYESVIITKWDETSSIGNVLSCLAEKRKPIAYIADGQKIPRQIKVATRRECLEHLSGFTVSQEHIDELYGEATTEQI